MEVMLYKQAKIIVTGNVVDPSLCPKSLQKIQNSHNNICIIEATTAVAFVIQTYMIRITIYTVLKNWFTG